MGSSRHLPIKLLEAQNDGAAKHRIAHILPRIYIADDAVLLRGFRIDSSKHRQTPATRTISNNSSSSSFEV